MKSCKQQWLDEKANFDLKPNINRLNVGLGEWENLNFIELRPPIVGTRASVFTVSHKITGKKYAIKCQIVRKIDNEAKLQQEIEHAYIYGNLGIGPLVHDYFYYKGNPDNFPNEITSMLNKMREPREHENLLPQHVQFIIMDKYDTDCADFLLYRKLGSLYTKIKVINKMCKLIEKMINYGIYCCDIKPSNFVINILGNLNDPDVKMVNFGCSHHSYSLDNEYMPVIYVTDNINNVGYTFTHININMFCVSLLVSLFMIIAIYSTSAPNNTEYAQDVYKWLYPGFSDTKLHQFLKASNWKGNITEYITDALESVPINEDIIDIRNIKYVSYKNIVTLLGGPGYASANANDKKQLNTTIITYITSNLEALGKYLEFDTALEPNPYVFGAPQSVISLPMLMIGAGLTGITLRMIYEVGKATMKKIRSRRVAKHLQTPSLPPLPQPCLRV